MRQTKPYLTIKIPVAKKQFVRILTLDDRLGNSGGYVNEALTFVNGGCWLQPLGQVFEHLRGGLPDRFVGADLHRSCERCAG